VDTSAIGAAIATRVDDVFDWFGVPTGSLLLKDSGPCAPVDVESQISAPRTVLLQNAPNPFTPRTTVRYTLGAGTNVSLAVFDAAGRHVRALHDAVEGPGAHAVTWDGRDDAGRPADSGVYWVRMVSGDGYRASTKVVVVK
jgi:hypothetical protein